MMEDKKLLDSVKKDVRSVLITESKGMVLHEFLKIFRELTTGPLPWRRLGYDSAEDFVRKIPDVCTWQLTAGRELLLLPVCDHSTSHVRQLVERSRRPRGAGGAGRRDLQGERQRPRATVTCPPAVRTSILQLLAQHPQGIHVDELNKAHRQRFGAAIAYVSLGFMSMNAVLESLGSAVRLKSSATGWKAFPVATKPAEALASAPGRPPGAAPLTAPLQSPAAPPARSVSAGVGGSSTEQRTSTPAAAPPQPQQFIKFEDQLKKLTDELEVLLRKQGSPVKVTEIHPRYQKHFQRCLDLKQYGFNTVLRALEWIGAPFRLQKEGNDWMVSLRSEKKNPSKLTNGFKAQPHRPHHGGDAGDSQGLSTPGSTTDTDGEPGGTRRRPDAAAVPRFTVGKLEYLEEDGTQAIIEDRGRSYPLLEVVVTHAVSPSEFYFSVPSALETLLRLDRQMAQRLGPGWRRQPPAPAQLVVCRPLAVDMRPGWRRAVMVGKAGDKVRVYLVDTGVTTLVYWEDVQLLPPELVQIPVHCYRGSLAGVGPVDGEWSAAALTLFSRLTTDPAQHSPFTLMATVLHQTEFCSELSLCDTRTSEDLHVGDALVLSGKAVTVPLDLAADPSDPVPLRTTGSQVLTSLYRVLELQQRVASARGRSGAAPRAGVGSVASAAAARPDQLAVPQTPQSMGAAGSAAGAHLSPRQLPPTGGAAAGAAAASAQDPPPSTGRSAAELQHRASASHVQQQPARPGAARAHVSPPLAVCQTPQQWHTAAAQQSTTPAAASCDAGTAAQSPQWQTTATPGTPHTPAGQILPRTPAVAAPAPATVPPSSTPITGEMAPSSISKGQPEQLLKMKSDCYDMMRQLQAGSQSATRRAMLTVRLRRLEAEVQRMEQAIDGGASETNWEA